MTVVNDRATTPAQRAAELPAAVPSRSAAADAAQATPPPRGWGSHQERRETLYTLAFFGVLGLYAAVFVLIGALIWS